MLHSLFVVPVYQVKFRELEEIEKTSFEKIISEIEIDRDIKIKEEIIYKKHGHIRQESNFNYHSKETFILDEYEDFSELKKFIEVHLRQYAKIVWNLNMRQNVQITQSWVNVNKKDESHHLHLHPNSFISGVFYYHCNNNDSISFKNPTTVGQSVLPSDKLIFNSVINNSIDFNVTTGDLILFPSWLEHKVNMNVHEKQRVSLSFNTQLTGVIGVTSHLTYSQSEYNKKFK